MSNSVSRLFLRLKDDPHHYVYTCHNCLLAFHSPDDLPTRIVLITPHQPSHTIAEYCPACAPTITESIYKVIRETT